MDNDEDAGQAERGGGGIRLSVSGGALDLDLEVLEHLELLDLEDPAVQEHIIDRIENARLFIVTINAVEAELEQSWLEAQWRAEPPDDWGDDGPPGPSEIVS